MAISRCSGFRATGWKRRCARARTSRLVGHSGLARRSDDTAVVQERGRRAVRLCSGRCRGAEALYAKAFAPFWDVRAGIRHGTAGAGQATHAVIGVQGLRPFMFPRSALALFPLPTGVILLRPDRGRDRPAHHPAPDPATADRGEPFRTGHRLRLGEIGAGSSDQIEIERACGHEACPASSRPCIGIEQSWRTGRSADFVRARGECGPSTTSFAGGSAVLVLQRVCCNDNTKDQSMRFDCLPRCPCHFHRASPARFSHMSNLPPRPRSQAPRPRPRAKSH